MSRSRIFSLFGLLLLALAFLAHSWHGPDIWYHLTWGRELISFGRWIPVRQTVFAQPIPANGYWLFQSLMYLSYQAGGLVLVSAVFAALWLSIGFLWFRIADVQNQSWKYGLALAALVCLQLRFEQRPEVFSYFFLTMMMYLGLRGRTWPLFIIQILWTNSHGYFVLGPLIALLALREGGASWRRGFGVAFGLLLATAVTPFGPKVWENVWLYLQLGRAMKDINHELMPPQIWPLHWSLAVFWLSWLGTLAAIVHAVVRREAKAATWLAALGLILSAQASRNMPLLFLLSPLLWRSIEIKWKQELVPALTGMVALILSVATIGGYYHRWTGSLATFGVKLEWASYPIGAVEALGAMGFKGRLFCDSYDGGYVEYHLPELVIAGDSYFADPEMTRFFFAAIKTPQALLQAEQAQPFDGYIINIENADIIEYLLQKSELVIAYADSHRLLFVSKSAFPNFSGDLSKFSFYHGEDLRHWAYEFGVVGWMDLAYRHQWTPVIFKILSDLSTANHIPKSAFQIAVKYASETRDQNLILALAPLKDRLHD